MCYIPAGIYLRKVYNWNTGTRCEICPKLTIKIPERRQSCRSGIFIVNFEHISHLVLVLRASINFKHVNAGWDRAVLLDILISLDIVSSIMIDNNGLNTEPRRNPTWTRKSSLKDPLTLTRFRAFLYIDCTTLNNHSSTHSFLKAHHTTFLGTPQKPSPNLQMQSTNSSLLLNISPVTISR